MARTINTLELFGVKSGKEVFDTTDVDENSFAPVLPKGDALFEPVSGTTKNRASYYDDTFTLGKRWDSQEPVLAKEENKKAYQDTKSYDADGKRQVNSLYFSDVLGISQEDAYIQHDQLGKVLFDADDTPDGYFKRIGGRWNAGKASVARSEAASKILIDVLRGKPFDPEAVTKAQQAGPKTTQDEMQKLRAWHEKMIGETVEQLPFTIEAMKYGVGGGLAGAGVGYFLKSPKTGAKVGGMLGAGARTAQLEAGGAFLEMLEIEDENGNKIDPQIAAAVSLGVGAVNGGLEVGELSVILGTFGVGPASFEAAASKASAKLLADGTLKQIALKHGFKFAGALGVETAQEIVQESSVIIGTEIAKELSNQRKGTDFDVAFDQDGFASAVAGRLVETGKKSLLGFPLLLGPGTVVSAVKEGAVQTLKATKEEIESREEVKETEDEVLADIVEDTQVDDVIENMSKPTPAKQEGVVATVEKANAQLDTAGDEVIVSGTLFHNTDRGSAESILKTGLKVEDTSGLPKDERGFATGNLGDGVYLSPDLVANQNIAGGDANVQIKTTKPLRLFNLGTKEGSASITIERADEIKRQGFDGIIVNDPNPQSGGFQVVVFDPANIEAVSITEDMGDIEASQELENINITISPTPAKQEGVVDLSETKVVDESRKPLTVFHGTKSQFTAFDPESLGSNTQAKTASLGFFFTEDEFVAKRFAGGDKAGVKEVNLNITSPLELFETPLKTRKTAFGSVVPQKAEFTGHNLLTAKGEVVDVAKMQKIGDAHQQLKKAVANRIGKEVEDLTVQDYKDWKDKVISMGHDGIKLKNAFVDADGRTHTVWIAFENDQIAAISPTPAVESAEQIKALPDEQKVDAIINQPVKIDEQGVVEEELTIEDKAALAKMEGIVEAENKEVVEPDVYIGNVTPRMKKVFAKEFGVDPEDIAGFKEGAFPTKRTKIKMTREQAETFHDSEIEQLLNKIDKNLINTEKELADINAQWGNIKSLRSVLGYSKMPRPFEVVRAPKRKFALYDKTKRLQDLTKKQLVKLAEAIDMDSSGTKATILARIKEEEAKIPEGLAQKIVRQEQEQVRGEAIRVIPSAKEIIRASIQPGVLEDANMTVGQVLNNTMKRVAQAARHAFSVGKKEGVAQTKEHFRQVKERLKARQKLKARINKALKKINAKIPRSVDFFYAEAVTKLQQEIDPKKRTKRTQERRQRQRDFLEQASPEEIKSFPQKLFDSLNAKPLNDVTVAELEELAGEIDKLKKLGKTKYKAKENIARSIRDKNIKESISDMYKGKSFPEQPTTGAKRNKEGLIKTLNSNFLQTLRIPRVLDWIDGAKGTFKGKMHNLFYNRVNEQTNLELIETDRRGKSMRENMDKLGITDNDLIQEIPVGGGVNMFIEEVMGVYAALKNPKAKEAMLAQLRISEKTALGIVTNLNPKFIELADAVIADYSDSYSRLRAAHIEFTNEDLGSELFYTPIVRLEKDGQLQNTDIVDQLLARQGLRRPQPGKGFTIERESIAPENQKPMNLRLMSVWRSQSAKQEHYTHFASLIKDLNGYLADSSFKKAINAKLGKSAHGILNDYVKRVASPDSYKGHKSWEHISRKLRGNIAMAYLSYNLLTVLKQAPSITLYLKDAGAANIMSSLGEFISDPKALIEKVKSKDPQVQHNLIAREFEQLRNANDPAYNKLIKKVGQAGLEGIKFIDLVTRSIGWNAVYTKELQLTGSEIEARREAQNSTLRTQPTASAKDIASLYTQNEVFNWFLMFTQQLNQIWNITTYDTFANWNNKNYQAAATDMLAVSLNAMFIWLISNKRLPEDEEDMLEMASDQFINMIPLIGKDIMGGKKGWGGAEVAPLKAAKEISKAVFSGDMEEAAMEVIKQSAAAKGVPVVAIKRAKEFLETGEPVELIGGTR